MSKLLDVYLHQDKVGQLRVRDGQMGFEYAADWLGNPSAKPLSRSLPLKEGRFSRKHCRGFFAGLLPEQEKRSTIARRLGVSEQNDFALLEALGGECAGAVTLMPAGEALPDTDYRYRDLSTSQLAEILQELPNRPLMAGEEGVRLSLAGAQDKIAVRVNEGKISLPLGTAPSTHILKPAIPRFAGVVQNEALCLNLASAIGLNVAKAEIGQVEGIEYLLVQRYDRKVLLYPASPPYNFIGLGHLHTVPHTPTIREWPYRLHQEDFCQALGIPPEQKYQNEGGPSLKQCFDLLREVSSVPAQDLQRILDAVIFNYLIGNHDAHGKNFSLLYISEFAILILNGIGVQLAPLYDLLCTVYYPQLSPKMAMKIGGEYDSADVTPEHFAQMAADIGFSEKMVVRRVPEMAETIIKALAEMEMTHPVARDIAKVIAARCERVLEMF